MPPRDPFHPNPLPVLTPEELAERLRNQGLKPMDVGRVEEKEKPKPPKIDTDSFWFRVSVLWSIWTKGTDYDLNLLNQGEKPVLIPLLLQLLQRDWWKIGLIAAVIIGLIVALIRLL